MTNSPAISEFEATAVAQALFDGSKADLLNDEANWQFGDYVITSPDEAWHVEKDGLARKEERLSRFVGGVAYALAVDGEIEPDTATPKSVSIVCAELERIACISLHKDGVVAGTAEYKRVQAERALNSARAERKEKGEWVYFLEDLAAPSGNYRRNSFV